MYVSALLPHSFNITPLSDNARFLLSRLLLRKTGKWYRVTQLKYISELGEAGIEEAMSELCCDVQQRKTEDADQLSQPIEQMTLERQGKEVIDLTLDEDEGACPVSRSRCIILL